MRLGISPYREEDREQWEDFIERSANGTFLQRRSFIEYHGDRFEDASLMVWEGEELLAVFPAHRVGDQIFSHQGLSFGGWIFNIGLEKSIQKEIINFTLNHFKKNGIEKLTVTAIPTFYHREAVFYYDLLMEIGFEIESVKDTAVIALPQEIKDRGKRWGVKKAKSLGISLEEKAPNENFWKELLLPYHLKKLGSPPVHSWEEVHQLYQRHPNQISLFQTSKGDEILAGLILFKYTNVIKIQYSAITEKGKSCRAMDLLIQELMLKCDKPFIDMGSSIDPRSKTEKRSLVSWKGSFGATLYQVSHLNYLF